MFKKILLVFFSLFFFSVATAEDFFLSLKKNRVNVRYGPSFESPVKFIYKKINLPLKQIDQKENWRRVIDLKNNSGWIHRSQLKPVNSIIPIEDKILFKKASIFSTPLARIQKGRILIVQKYSEGWCLVKSADFKGWIKTENIWGLIN